MNINPSPAEMQPTRTLEAEQASPGAIEAISRAEIDMSIATARRFPRQLSKVKQDMLSFATLDSETAEGCFYTLPRGGKNIEGPSVRLAEIAVACYGNLRAGSRIIETVTGGDSPHVTVQAVAMDLEKNVNITIEKRRRITSKKDFKTGGRKPIDEDDINLAANAGAAIAFRDAVFKVVPLALIKPVFEAAKKVAIGDAKTLTDRRARMFSTLGKMHVRPEQILAKIDKKSIDDVGVDDLATIFGLFNAVKDGEISLDDAFPVLADKTAQASPIVPAPQKQKAPEPEASKTVPLSPETATTTSGSESSAPQPAEPEATQSSEAQPQSAQPETATAPETKPQAIPDDPAGCLKLIESKAAESGVTIKQVLGHLYALRMAYADKHKELGQLSTAKLQSICKNWPNLVEKIRAVKV